jgi:hypothetical protein
VFSQKKFKFCVQAYSPPSRPYCLDPFSPDNFSRIREIGHTNDEICDVLLDGGDNVCRGRVDDEADDLVGGPHRGSNTSRVMRMAIGTTSVSMSDTFGAELL